MSLLGAYPWEPEFSNQLLKVMIVVRQRLLCLPGGQSVFYFSSLHPHGDVSLWFCCTVRALQELSHTGHFPIILSTSLKGRFKPSAFHCCVLCLGFGILLRFILYFYFMCMCVDPSGHMSSNACGCPRKPDKDIIYTWTGDAGSHELPNVGAGNQAQVLCDSIQCS